MDQRPTGLSVTKAITGFLQYKSAEGLAPVTVSGYERDLKLWIEYQGDMGVARVETRHILSYLNYLLPTMCRAESRVIIPKSFLQKPSTTCTSACARFLPGRAGSSIWIIP